MTYKNNNFQVPLSTPPTLKNTQSIPEKLLLIQKYISELQYPFRELCFKVHGFGLSDDCILVLFYQLWFSTVILLCVPLLILHCQ